MKVDKVYTETQNKWTIVIEGIEKDKRVKTYCSIPPTDGDRLDIITDCNLKDGYAYDISGVIVVNILNGFPHIRFYDKGKP